MVSFYYHYDKDTHQAKLVYGVNGKAITVLTNKIICNVPTETKRSDMPPKFVVSGYCNKVEDVDGIIYLMN